MSAPVRRALGRHVEHDPRSKRFAVHAVAADQRPLRSVTWLRVSPILDQKDLGACTCMAAVGLLGTMPFLSKVAAARQLAPARAACDLLNENLAIELYKVATKLDRIPGHYPPEDTGSSGLAAAKALHRRGFISEYGHAFGIRAALRALLDGPVMTGIPWYEGFDEPVGVDGELVKSGVARGGHEVLIRAVDLPRRRVFGDSSWGTGYGVRGGFSMSFDLWEELLAEDGDVTTVRI